jgi:hypothetical protein
MLFLPSDSMSGEAGNLQVADNIVWVCGYHGGNCEEHFWNVTRAGRSQGTETARATLPAECAWLAG